MWFPSVELLLHASYSAQLININLRVLKTKLFTLTLTNKIKTLRSLFQVITSHVFISMLLLPEERAKPVNVLIKWSAPPPHPLKKGVPHLVLTFTFTYSSTLSFLCFRFNANHIIIITSAFVVQSMR